MRRQIVASDVAGVETVRRALAVRCILEATWGGRVVMAPDEHTPKQPYDHPFNVPLEHALKLDFVNESLGPGARVAVALSAESARAPRRAATWSE